MKAELEPLEEVEDSTAFGRTLALLVGVAALVGACLATLEVESQRAEGAANARSSRLAVQISGDGLVFGTRDTFMINAEGDAVRLSVLATSRSRVGRFLVVPNLREPEMAIAEAQDASVSRINAIAKEMGATPGTESGLDPATRRSLATNLETLNDLVHEQNREADRADDAAGRHRKVVFALTMLAFAAILIGLSGTLKEANAGWSILGGASLLLMVSISFGALAAVG